MGAFYLKTEKTPQKLHFKISGVFSGENHHKAVKTLLGHCDIIDGP